MQDCCYDPVGITGPKTFYIQSIAITFTLKFMLSCLPQDSFNIKTSKFSWFIHGKRINLIITSHNGR